MFLPRLAHLSIKIQEKFAETPKGQEAEHDIFSSNFINLSQFIRKKEMPSDVKVGEPEVIVMPEVNDNKDDHANAAAAIIDFAADVLKDDHSRKSSKSSQHS